MTDVITHRTSTASGIADPVAHLLPLADPVRFLNEDGTSVRHDDTTAQRYAERGYALPPVADLVAAWRGMVLGRRFDAQATALTKQGRLAVYPSSRGQDACQVVPVQALTPADWLFPTYRDSMALLTRGIDPIETLTLLRGSWHGGYDPIATQTAPQCTPLATQALHAAGAADGMRRRGTGGVALCFIGDGATSEGDFHEGLNFAAVFSTPTVFFVQNNTYAISVPLAKQTKAPALAYKGVGYGIRSEQVDGNDAAAVLAVTRAAYQHARAGHGPVLIEAHTYRLEAHTNADDATRYRQASEVQGWLGKDPIVRLQTWLVQQGAIDEARIEEVRAEAEELAGDVRTRMNVDPELDPMALFDHVLATPTPQLREQREMVAAELAHQHMASSPTGDSDQGDQR